MTVKENEVRLFDVTLFHPMRLIVGDVSLSAARQDCQVWAEHVDDGGVYVVWDVESGKAVEVWVDGERFERAA